MGSVRAISVTGAELDDAAVEWLLSSDEPGVRLRTRRDLLGEMVPAEAFEAVADGPKARSLLEGLGPDGAPGEGWGGGPQWRLLALFDLGVPGDEPRIRAAAEWVVDSALRRPQHNGHPTIIDGLHRFCANVEGNALTVALGSGMDPSDPRVVQLAGALIDWQWPDGGWNCHRNARRRSTFHESLSAAQGLHRYCQATGNKAAHVAVRRTAELFLQHRLIFSLGSGTPSRRQPRPPAAGEVINERWQKLSYPSYWHYDVLSALRFLAELDRCGDDRASDAINLLRGRRRSDGLWAADRQWWSIGGSSRQQQEVVDWGRAGQPSEMITFHAMRILHATASAEGSRSRKSRS